MALVLVVLNIWVLLSEFQLIYIFLSIFIHCTIIRKMILFHMTCMYSMDYKCIV